MFHARDGLFFQAVGGSVRVIKTSDGHEPNGANVVCDVTLPENEWASVVCSVSAVGETAGRWREARVFHGTAAA